MSYLELARKCLESSSTTKPDYGPNTLQGCEKSEKSEESEKSHPAMGRKCEKSENSPQVMDSENDERLVCRAIERELGLPPGSLTLWDPVR
jgi:hypothetical protein